MENFMDTTITDKPAGTGKTPVKDLVERCRSCFIAAGTSSTVSEDQRSWVEAQQTRLRIFADVLGVFALPGLSADIRLQTQDASRRTALLLLQALEHNLKLCMTETGAGFPADAPTSFGTVNTGPGQHAPMTRHEDPPSSPMIDLDHDPDQTSSTDDSSSSAATDDQAYTDVASVAKERIEQDIGTLLRFATILRSQRSYLSDERANTFEPENDDQAISPQPATVRATAIAEPGMIHDLGGKQSKLSSTFNELISSTLEKEMRTEDSLRIEGQLWLRERLHTTAMRRWRRLCYMQHRARTLARVFASNTQPDPTPDPGQGLADVVTQQDISGYQADPRSRPMNDMHSRGPSTIPGGFVPTPSIVQKPPPSVIAPSVSHETTLDIMLPRDYSFDGTTWEYLCPLCHLAQAVKSKKKRGFIKGWQRHVIEDLAPYVCVEQDCDDPLQTFTTVEAWTQHREAKHATHCWVCEICDVPTLLTSGPEYINHVERVHSIVVPPNMVEFTLDASMRNVPFELQRCLICGSETGVDELEDIAKLHFADVPAQQRSLLQCLTKHLETLALSCLPDQLSLESDGESAFAEESRSNGSDISMPSAYSLDSEVVGYRTIREHAQPVVPSARTIPSWRASNSDASDIERDTEPLRRCMRRVQDCCWTFQASLAQASVVEADDLSRPDWQHQISRAKSDLESAWLQKTNANHDGPAEHILDEVTDPDSGLELATYVGRYGSDQALDPNPQRWSDVSQSSSTNPTNGTQGNMMARGVSLRSLLTESRSGPLRSRVTRYNVALSIATAHLKLHSTSSPWRQWQSKDILFPLDEHRADDADRILFEQPYISANFIDPLSVESHQLRPPNRSFACLGIMLIELLFSMHLEDHGLWRRNGLAMHQSDPWVRVMVAMKWSDDVEDEAGRGFANAVQWCLRDSPVTLAGVQWRHELIHRVIQPLRHDCESLGSHASWKHTAHHQEASESAANTEQGLATSADEADVSTASTTSPDAPSRSIRVASAKEDEGLKLDTSLSPGAHGPTHAQAPGRHMETPEQTWPERRQETPITPQQEQEQEQEQDMDKWTQAFATAIEPEYEIPHHEMLESGQSEVPARSAQRHQHLESGPWPRPSARLACSSCGEPLILGADDDDLSITVPFPVVCSSCKEPQLQRPSAVPIPRQQIRPQPSPRAYRCDVDGCFTTCKRLADLHRHKLNRHRLADLHYQCSECDARSYREDRMSEHCRKRHGQLVGEKRYSEVSGRAPKATERVVP